ncbi:MAG: alpha/beta hydrolase [Gammaproteobacteria bacterium]|nr:alpha/beta hydrolase [Gammaproteobacteria bacterium]
MYVARVPAREEIINVRGLKYRVLFWGPICKDPFILLHGYQDCADTFQFLVDELPREWSFAAVDWRGFGGSQATSEPYWFPDYLADLECLLECLVPGGAARLIGHSMGGNVASLYAGVRPARIRQLISLEGFGMPRTTPTDAPKRYRDWLDQLQAVPHSGQYSSVAKLAKNLVRRNTRLSHDIADFIARAWTKPNQAGGVQLRFDPWHRLINPILYRREEYDACWREITADTLLLIGAESVHLSMLEGNEVAAPFGDFIANLTIKTLPSLGHMMHHENPALVAKAILDWVKV